MAKKKSVSDRISETVDHIFHGDSNDQSGESSGQVESTVQVAEVEQAPEAAPVLSGEVVGQVGNEKYDLDAEKKHSKFDKFK